MLNSNKLAMITRVSSRSKKTKNIFNKQRSKQGVIFVISGPSGSGKTTLSKELVNSRELKGLLVKSVSYTTRKKRSGEKDARDYFFIGERAFLAKRKAKKILEWTKYLGYYYATPKEFIDNHIRRGRNVILCLDLKGAGLVKRHYPGNAVTIFVEPPSLDELSERIRKRCRQTACEEVRQRLLLAGKEMNFRKASDYCVVNKDFPKALALLKGIILKEIAKKHR